MKKGVTLILTALILTSFLGVFVIAENDSGISVKVGANAEANSDSSDNEIKTTGTIEYPEIEGGCWIIRGDNGETYQPRNMEERFKQNELRVEFEGELREDMASTCQAGAIIELKDIERRDDSENEDERDKSETRVRERTEIRYGDGTRIRTEFELRERHEISGNERRNIIETRNRLRIDSDSETPENCTRAGATLRCEVYNEERNETRTELTIRAGNSGNIIRIQSGNTNATTNVTLYHHDGRVFGSFGGVEENDTREIILPDEARNRVESDIRTRARLRADSINLTEEGRYQIEAKKRARLFFLIPVEERVRAEVDAETGAVLRARNPWWGFLARDVRAESRTETNATAELN